jgi:integrase
MARQYRRLTVARLGKLKSTPGKHADGDGLYLTVTRKGAASWSFRYMRGGGAHWHGLGPLRDLTLAQARDAAQRCRQLLREGLDPIEERRAKRLTQAVDAARSLTFRECAEAYVKAHEAGWRNAEHRRHWWVTLETYVNPTIGALPVNTIDTAIVMKCLEPIWLEKTETASRTRGRIEAVLGWATSRGFRSGDNPARWKGHLENLLPARSKVRNIAHHAALPYSEIGDFIGELRDQEGVAARALEFLILTVARRGEVVGAKWSEIDLDKRLWTVPAGRTKRNREHRVPLSGQAVEILEEMQKLRDGEFVFTGIHPVRPLGDEALPKALQRVGRTNVTVHGFRSCFRDWAAELTNFPREVAEMALAHAVSDKTEAAYRRGDLFEKRRQLAEAWAKFCAAPRAAGAVLPLRRTAG